MSLLSQLPSVDSLLLRSKDLVRSYGHQEVSKTFRNLISGVREEVIEKKMNSLPTIESFISLASKTLKENQTSSLKKVINLTGTVLHTNLGRAELPQCAIDAIAMVAANYTNLEFNIETGKRGDRAKHIESLIIDITGAEAATLVNNNAAAVLLTLNTLARGKQVPVSRGELVEIGGSFRIREVMQRSGCELIEVGATNRTHEKDYTNAITDQTALLMKVHTSNYEIKGFTSGVSDSQLAAIAHKHQIPFITDLGSGTLIDLQQWGLPFEPTVQATLQSGADIVTFSGDKLLGGPQCGIIVGKKELINLIKNNPMKRALRVNKMTIAALFEVLKLYLDPDSLKEKLPTLRYLTRSKDEIKALASTLLKEVSLSLDYIAKVEILPCESQIGSGSLPTDLLPSYALAITPNVNSDHVLTNLAKQFRTLPQALIGRISDGKIIFDLRTLESKDTFLKQIRLMSK